MESTCSTVAVSTVKSKSSLDQTDSNQSVNDAELSCHYYVTVQVHHLSCLSICLFLVSVHSILLFISFLSISISILSVYLPSMIAPSLPFRSLRAMKESLCWFPGQDQQRCKVFSLLCRFPLEQPPAVCLLSHLNWNLQETSQNASL